MSLDDRLAALADAVALADGRLEPEAVEHARAVVERAGRRLGLGVEATVAALAGPTGAGKSSLMNALAGAELSTVGVRRPTTATAAAAIWGDAPDALLEWLRVPRRHHVAPPGPLGGLVLLDLPDFDSVERDHRLEVDRVLELADLVVWVVDPQKYADASLHERYLRPLAGHAAAMVVALNQADRLPDDAVERLRADLRGLLEQDGLRPPPVLPVSARTGQGLDALRGELRDRVAARTAAATRLAADVGAAAAELEPGCAGRDTPGVGRGDRERLIATLEEAAGIPGVTRAVERAHRRRGALATGWPFVRWVRRLRPDPVRRLRLGDRPDAATVPSLPPPTPVQTAQVDAAARGLANATTRDLPEPWPGVVRRAATAREDALAGRLHQAVAGADLHLRAPRWWTLAGLLQKGLALVALAGALWLLAIAALGYLQLDDVLDGPEIEGFALPTVLLLGGVLAGLVVAFLTRLVNGVGARRRARAARRSLRAGVQEVAQEHVLSPVQAELDAHDRLCHVLRRAGPARAGSRSGP